MHVRVILHVIRQSVVNKKELERIIRPAGDALRVVGL
jgi:hypothetical protein